tara:strand:+ start:521 stop:868 length:348 start_codon:yes stop_codon:yes gene_type:complete
MIHPYTFIGLADRPQIRRISSCTVDNMCELIADYTGINKELIRHKTRKREFVLARQIIYAILRKHYNLSLNQIGGLFSKDHSTIIHSLEVHECDYETDRLYKKTFDYVEKKVLFW